jgi:hypothetical protein
MRFVIGSKVHVFARGFGALFSAREAPTAIFRRGRCSGFTTLPVLFFWWQ